MPEYDLIRDALQRFCRSFISKDRIEELRRVGISDEDLAKKFRNYYATSGGCGGPDSLWMQYWVNDKTAKVWIGDVSDWWKKKPTYEGKGLVLVVRQAMGFPYPGGIIQEALFNV